MKRVTLISLALFLFTLTSAAQTTTYLGKGKVYQLPNNEYDYLYLANITFANSTLYNSILYANKINLYENNSFTSYQSSHGDYVSFQSNYCMISGKNASCEQFMFYYPRLGTGNGYYAFVIKNNKLYIVDVKTDIIISNLMDVSSMGSDFAIVVNDNNGASNYYNPPTIWIVNNGYITIFDSIPTSVNSPKYEIKTSKTFDLNGMETKTPHDGVFIQNGKKVVIK